MSSEHQSSDKIYQKVILNRVIVSAVVSFMLDYSSTFPREVALIWRKKAGLGGVLYFSARYSLGISMILSLCANFLMFPLKVALLDIYPTYQLIYSACSRFYGYQKNDELMPHIRTCTSVKISSGSALMICQLSMQTMLGIRAYAISNQSRYVLVGLVFILVGYLGSSLVITGTLSCGGNVPGVLICVRRSPTIMPVFTSVAIIIFDAVLIVVTFHYTRELRRLQTNMRSDKKRLTSLLIQQGLLRFCFSIIRSLILTVPVQYLPVTWTLCNYFVPWASVSTYVRYISYRKTDGMAFGAMTEELGNSFLTRPPLVKTRTLEDGERNLQLGDHHTPSYAPPSPSQFDISFSPCKAQGTQ
ncbi:hypothetical protein K439DRAFT_1619531 [Ramaria rubella]|nr:hypothetical protein K439DRAFT_1619531 [Ramaria rubella]